MSAELFPFSSPLLQVTLHMVRRVQSFCKRRVAQVEDRVPMALEFSSSSAPSTHDDHFIPSFTMPHEAMKPALSALDRVPALNTYSLKSNA